jgi:hypothetical protein
MFLYLSNDVASAPLPPHLAPGARRCSAIALGLEGVGLRSSGDSLRVLPLTRRLFSRHQRVHVLPGGIAAIASLPLSFHPPSILLFSQMLHKYLV